VVVRFVIAGPAESMGPKAPHTFTEEVEFLGTGLVTTSKSVKLLSVSWQPFIFRTAPVVMLKAATAAPPSALFAVPQESTSTIVVDGNVQGVAVAPQPRAVATFTNAIFPLAAPRLRLAEIKSGVTGRSTPAAPAVPTCISRYAPAAIVVFAWKPYIWDAELPKLPVAEPY
jgi:hypothetical protein